ncbi:hypothetical protein [Amycolatopsis silviterrae]|uniref:Uncharacterized protein n=1 Tax=Amycolatopsis silviterrae TaxID=1656914 RepID=A0ABW5HE62_9PSEU
MRKRAGRMTALGVALAAPLLSAALAFPATASADPNPTVTGDCESTLQNGKNGTGLALDAGAPLNAPNRVTVGLDSKAKQADGNNTLLNVPVGDTVRALGVGEVPVVGETAAKDTCPFVQAAGNGVGNTTQALVGGLPGTPLPTPPPTPKPPNPTPHPPSPAPGPGGPGQPAPGGDSLGPVTTGGGLSGLGSVSGIFTGAAMLPASFVQAPIVTQVVPGQLPQGQVPTVDAKKSGTAEALPAANPPARLPLLIAVLALAMVAAALVRAWLRRKPA